MEKSVVILLNGAACSLQHFLVPTSSCLLRKERWGFGRGILVTLVLLLYCSLFIDGMCVTPPTQLVKCAASESVSMVASTVHCVDSTIQLVSSSMGH
jgi:hypothetical protein